MKTFISYLAAIFLMMFCAGAGMAQNEGKHLGSTQDVARAGESVYVSSNATASEIPGANNSGGKYGTGMYSEETGMYLIDQWQPGYGVLTDGSRLSDILLRYDIYHQQMQFVSDNDTLAFSNPEELNYLVINEKRFIYEEFENNGVLDKGYFEVLKDGDCKLLLRRTVTHHVVKDVSATEVQDEYLRDVRYYVKKKDNMAREIRACKKSVLCVFKDEEEKVREFIKANELKMNSCEDLMQVVAFYNSLY